MGASNGALERRRLWLRVSRLGESSKVDWRRVLTTRSDLGGEVSSACDAIVALSTFLACPDAASVAVVNT